MSSVASLLPAAGTIGGALLGGPVGAAIGGVAGQALAGAVGGNGAQNTFQAGGANVINPYSQQDVLNAQGQSEQALAQQQQFLQALQAQNGVQNQSNVFGQLQGVANGTGPNPAQAMLNNSTGANVANQAALMAGQRGAGANVGMIARQAGQQGAATQQQAIGQGAALQATQSLNALNQMGGIAGQQVAQQATATGANTQYNQNQQAMLNGSIQGVNNANVGMQSNINSVNAGVAAGNAQQNANMQGNILGAVGSAAQLIGSSPAKPSAGGNINSGIVGAGTSNDLVAGATDNSAFLGGGMAMMATGGAVTGPRSKVGQHFHGMKPMFAEGGTVPALVSPGEVYLKPEAVQKVAQGADPIAAGEKIPGKAKVKGNSYANDTVSAELEEGGIVLPRSVMESKNPHWAAHKFVQEVMAKKGMQSLPKKG